MSRSQAETAIADYIDGFYNPTVGTRRWTSQAPSNSRQKQCNRCRAPPLFLGWSSFRFELAVDPVTNDAVMIGNAGVSSTITHC